MPGSLGQQLAEALSRAQERASPKGKATPESTALNLLKEEFSSILKQDEKSEKSGKKGAGQRTGAKSGEAKLGWDIETLTRTVPWQTTPFTFWLETAKPGDQFAVPVKNVRSAAGYATAVRAAGKHCHAEAIHAIHGTAKNPELTPLVFITITDKDDEKPVRDAEPESDADGDDAESGGVQGGVSEDGAAVSPRQRGRSK